MNFGIKFTKTKDISIFTIVKKIYSRYIMRIFINFTFNINKTLLMNLNFSHLLNSYKD